MFKRFRSRRDAADGADMAEEPVAAPPALRRPRGFNLALLWFLAFLGVAAALGGAGFFAFNEMEARVAAERQALLKAQGERLTAEMAARVQALTDMVERAAAQPALVPLMAGTDPAATTAQADAIAASIPGALRVRLLPLGATQTDATLSPRLGYAGLELAHQAESGARPGLEIHWPGASDEYIAVARPVAAPAQPPAGVLLVAIDPKLLERWLAAALPEGAYAEVRQTADGQTVIAARGDKSRSAQAPSGTASLAGTHWEVAWWLPPMAAPSLQAQLGFAIPFGGALLLVGLLFAILGATTNRLVRVDLKALLIHFAALAEHRREKGEAMRLRYFREAVDALDDHFHPAAAPHAEPTPVKSAPAPSAVPENPLFLPEDTIHVEEVDAPGDKQ